MKALLMPGTHAERMSNLCLVESLIPCLLARALAGTLTRGDFSLLWDLHAKDVERLGLSREDSALSGEILLRICDDIIDTARRIHPGNVL